MHNRFLTTVTDDLKEKIRVLVVGLNPVWGWERGVRCAMWEGLEYGHSDKRMARVSLKLSSL